MTERPPVGQRQRRPDDRVPTPNSTLKANYERAKRRLKKQQQQRPARYMSHDEYLTLVAESIALHGRRCYVADHGVCAICGGHDETDARVETKDHDACWYCQGRGVGECVGHMDAAHLVEQRLLADLGFEFLITDPGLTVPACRYGHHNPMDAAFKTIPLEQIPEVAKARCTEHGITRLETRFLPLASLKREVNL